MITILGPTASGKTSLATHLAFRLGSEIISADSRQLYRGMDIGTGKDLSEYTVNGHKIPYHLIDILPAGSKYNLFAFQQDFHRVYEDMLRRGVRIPILCGGTGLYLEAILSGYNLPDVPENPSLRQSLANLSQRELANRLASYPSPLHNKTDLESPQRTIRAIEIADYLAKQTEMGLSTTTYPPIKSLIIGLSLDRDERRKRISDRLDERLREGMVDEIRGLIESGVAPKDLIYYGLEYKYVTLHATGLLSFDEMHNKLEIEIHRFAKRQMTWFRGMERRGLRIHWVDALLPLSTKVDEIIRLAEQHPFESNAKVSFT